MCVLHHLPCLHMLCMSTLCARKVAHDSCGPDGPRSIPAGALLPQRVVRSDLYIESTKATKATTVNSVHKRHKKVDKSDKR